MPEYKVLGVQLVDFKGKDGSPVQGTKLYCSYEEESEFLQGEKVETLFFSKMRFGSLDVVPGDHLAVSYNRYGKVDDFSVVS